MRSKAQVSEAKTNESRSRPSASGRKPCGSRTAIILVSVRKISENAPCTWRSAATMRSTVSDSRAWAMRWTMTSVSLDEAKIDPAASRRARTSPALTRLPLWATAMPPWA
jgi:hypothetical protein